MHTNFKLTILFLFFLLPIYTSAQHNSKFIRAETPDTVITDEVFQAHIYFKNTGTEGWGLVGPKGSEKFYLHSQNSTKNMNWGTYFIILGQTNHVYPGDTAKFSSRLKAPSNPGIYNFEWQCQKPGETIYFGEISTKKIVVLERKEKEPEPAPRIDSLIYQSDLEYQGSFALPGIDGFENKYNESGLTIKKNTDGSNNLLLYTGSLGKEQTLYEIEIPELTDVSSGNESGIVTAKLIREWGELTFGEVNDEQVKSSCQFWFDNKTSILYWTYYHKYFTGGPDDIPTLAATKLNADGTLTNLKYWYQSKVDNWKGYWSGVISLPETFSKKYAGGREMALGFGGYFNIAQTCSRGASLAAIHTPELTKDTVELLEFMSYPDPISAPRPGNYFAANYNYWADSPKSPWEGKWTYNDRTQSGVFIDLPDKKGYVTIAELQFGRVGYDYGGYSTDRRQGLFWYFYNYDDLGNAALGNVTKESLQPYSYERANLPFTQDSAISSFTQLAFDSESRTLYVYLNPLKGSNQLPLRGWPAIHVYKIKKSLATYSGEETVLNENKFNFRLTPNPATANTRIIINHLPEINNTLEISVYDLSGAIVKKLYKKVHGQKGEIEINTMELAKGTYIVQINANEQFVVSKKLLKR